MVRSFDSGAGLTASRCVFDYERKRRSLAELDRRTQTPGFWDDAAAAQRAMKELSGLRDDVEAVAVAERGLDEAQETLDILGDEPGAQDEAGRLIAAAEARIDGLEMAANFDGEYDDHGAIVTISAGAGGVDAADWTQMLARMYLRWAAAKDFETVVSDESPAEEAGLKSITFFVRGKHAYGMLEGERGVHRLVRISPFDAQHRRHTSFAQVDVIPEILEDEAGAVAVKPEDLRIETFKSGGAGGQYVNKTESAIRIIHEPSGIIVSSQQERSQQQNREVAMTMLRSQLAQRELAEREARLAALRGDRSANEWGSQIRSYVLQPYTMVKDHRTGAENSNAFGVLEGDIDAFVWPYLQQRRHPAAAAG